MGQKPTGNLKRDINKLIEPKAHSGALKERAARSPIEAQKGSGKAAESASGGGDGLTGEYTSTDGLFTIYFE